MLDIKIGEYIRTKEGYIRKVIKRDEDNQIVIDRPMEFFMYITETEENEGIEKHRKNIIDLIEEGDILKINNDGWEMIINYDKDNFDLNCEMNIEALKQYMKKNNWKLLSILTHELFERNSYKVEE